MVFPGLLPVDLAFLGTPAFAVPSLEHLLKNGHRVRAVLTQPDRPKGRSHDPAASPVKQASLRLGLPLHQPERIRDREAVELLRGLRLDAMAVVGYGQIIPQSVIDLVPLGIINVHASLLPKYRGAAPIQWAIANQETQTGVTTMRIDAGLDTGEILLQAAAGIGPEVTAPELSGRLSTLGAELLIETLAGLAGGRLDGRPQDHSQATLAPILRKEDGRIDWNWPAARIHARSRGFQPWPGVYSTFRAIPVQVWKCSIAGDCPGGVPGTLRASGRRLSVVCGELTALELDEIQLAGRKRISAQAFLNGHSLLQNERLGGESGS